MSLRRKVALILAAVALMQFVLLLGFARFHLRERAESVEQTRLEETVSRLHASLWESLNALDLVVHDYAAWDDSCAFIAGEAPEYVASNLNPETFLQARRTFMVYLARDRRVVFSRWMDLETGKEIPTPGSLLSYLDGTAPMLGSGVDHPEASQRGLLALPEGIFFVSVRPIIRSDFSGPVQGWIIAGQPLDDAWVAANQQRSGIHLRVEAIPGLPYTPPLKVSHAPTSGDYAVEAGDEALAAVVRYQGLGGDAHLRLQVDLPRDLHAQYLATIRSLIPVLLLTTLLGALLILWLLQQTLLWRVERLSHFVRQVRSTVALATRSDDRGNDEIGALAQSVNAMLARMEENWRRHLRDQIDLREAKDKAEAADQAKGQFLAIMSHELRTPLNPIINFAALIGSETQDESHREMTASIEKSGRQLLGLVEGLLEYVKLDSGSRQVPLAPLSIPHALAEVESAYIDQAEARGIRFQCNPIPIDFPQALAHPEYTRRALRSLLDNAFKFTSTGEVRLGAELAQVGAAGEEEIVLTVADTGIGIPSGWQDRIFDPFNQVDVNLNRPFEGAGVGLAIARKLAMAMEGRITVESIAGRGSCFRLHLRVAPKC